MVIHLCESNGEQMTNLAHFKLASSKKCVIFLILVMYNLSLW